MRSNSFGGKVGFARTSAKMSSALSRCRVSVESVTDEASIDEEVPNCAPSDSIASAISSELREPVPSSRRSAVMAASPGAFAGSWSEPAWTTRLSATVGSSWCSTSQTWSPFGRTAFWISGSMTCGAGFGAGRFVRSGSSPDAARVVTSMRASLMSAVWVDMGLLSFRAKFGFSGRHDAQLHSRLREVLACDGEHFLGGDPLVLVHLFVEAVRVAGLAVIVRQAVRLPEIGGGAVDDARLGGGDDLLDLLFGDAVCEHLRED